MKRGGGGKVCASACAPLRPARPRPYTNEDTYTHTRATRWRGDTGAAGIETGSISTINTIPIWWKYVCESMRDVPRLGERELSHVGGKQTIATSYRPPNLYEMTTIWSDELNIRSDCELGAVETKAQKAVRPLAVPSLLPLHLIPLKPHQVNKPHIKSSPKNLTTTSQCLSTLVDLPSPSVPSGVKSGGRREYVYTCTSSLLYLGDTC